MIKERPVENRAPTLPRLADCSPSLCLRIPQQNQSAALENAVVLCLPDNQFVGVMVDKVRKRSVARRCSAKCLRGTYVVKFLQFNDTFTF